MLIAVPPTVFWRYNRMVADPSMIFVCAVTAIVPPLVEVWV